MQPYFELDKEDMMEQTITLTNAYLDYNIALTYEKDINKEQIKVQMIEEGLEKLPEIIKHKIECEAMVARAEAEVFVEIEKTAKYRNTSNDGFEASITAAKEKKVKYLECVNKLRRMEEDQDAILRRLKGINDKTVSKVYRIIDAYNPDDKKAALQTELKTVSLEYENVYKQLRKCQEYYSIVRLLCDLSMMIRADIADGGDLNTANECIEQCKPLLNRVAELNSFVLKEGEFYITFNGDYSIKSISNWHKLEAELKRARENLRLAINMHVNYICKKATDYYHIYSELLEKSDIALEKHRCENAEHDAKDEDLSYVEEMLAQVESQLATNEDQLNDLSNDIKKCNQVLGAFNVNVPEYNFGEVIGINSGAEFIVYALLCAFDFILIPYLLIRALSVWALNKKGQSDYNNKVNANLPGQQQTLDTLQNKYPNLLSANDDFVQGGDIKSADSILGVVAKVKNMKEKLSDTSYEVSAEKRYLQTVKAKLNAKKSELERAEIQQEF